MTASEISKYLVNYLERRMSPSTMRNACWRLLLLQLMLFWLF